MNKKLIKDKYKEKIKLINHYNKNYYNDNVSEIPDSDYDTLKKKLYYWKKNIIF